MSGFSSVSFYLTSVISPIVMEGDICEWLVRSGILAMAKHLQVMLSEARCRPESRSLNCLVRFSKNKPQAQIKILSHGFALIAPLFPWLCDIRPLLFGQSGMLISHPVGEEDRLWKDGVVTQGLLYQKRWNPVVMSFSHEQSWSSPSLRSVIFLSWIMIIVVDGLHFLITRLSHV